MFYIYYYCYPFYFGFREWCDSSWSRDPARIVPYWDSIYCWKNLCWGKFCSILKTKSLSIFLSLGEDTSFFFLFVVGQEQRFFFLVSKNNNLCSCFLVYFMGNIFSVNFFTWLCTDFGGMAYEDFIFPIPLLRCSFIYFLQCLYMLASFCCRLLVWASVHTQHILPTSNCLANIEILLKGNKCSLFVLTWACNINQAKLSISEWDKFLCTFNIVLYFLI